jgi:hypothetical protein
VTPPFHPAADWPGALPETPESPDMPAARLEAYRRVEQDLPVPCEVYAVRAWLETAPAGRLLSDLMRCVLAADCWNARVPSPRGRFRGGAWAGYFGTRLRTAPPFLSQTLARWAVLERIPVRWIPERKVSAQICAHIAAAGLPGDVTALTLVPPVTGGTEWVVRDCPGSTGALIAHAQNGPVAAILHWPARTAAAVVTTAQEGLKAFGTAFGANGLTFAATELAGSVVVPATAPPIPVWYRILRALGIHEIAWKMVRRWRAWRGVNPLAAL